MRKSRFTDEEGPWPRWGRVSPTNRSLDEAARPLSNNLREAMRHELLAPRSSLR